MAADHDVGRPRSRHRHHRPIGGVAQGKHIDGGRCATAGRPAPRLPGSIARRQGLAHVLDTVRPQYKGPAPVLMSDDFDRARRRREIDGDRRGG
jgi:hypothetical protein